jgi:decaprenyl-phosphate phosphoribosyltransferase
VDQTSEQLGGTSLGALLLGLVKGVRPTQWTKNALVVAAPAAAGALLAPEVALRTFVAVVVFCLASGGTYLLNDARDVAADRQHPTKRNRPVANGSVPVPAAYGVGVALLAAAIATSFVVSFSFGIIVVAYLLLTTAYSFGLKNVAVVDLVVVAAGFVLRAAAGAAATGIALSEWFMIATSAGALLLITAKREAELKRVTVTGSTASRAVLAHYTPSFLASVRSIATGLVLVAYCLWAFADGNALPAAYAQASLVPFAVAVLRYVMLADAGAAEKPERLIMTDRVLLTAGTLWAVIYGYGIYFS